MVLTTEQGLLLRIIYFKEFILALMPPHYTFYMFPIYSRHQHHNPHASASSLLGIQLSLIEGNKVLIKKILD